MIQSIQTLRAIAALSVVAVHIPPDIRARGYGEVFDFPQGAFGVDLFFVISGFVMAYSSRHLFAREHAPCEFILRRCARIVPTYWLVTTFVLYLSIKARTDLSWQHTAASYLFIPYPRPGDGAMLPLLLLGWTLNYEMFFYGVFAVGLRLRRGAAIAAIAVLFVLMTIAGLAYPLPEPLRFWTDSQILEFVYGMLLAETYLRGIRMPRVAAGLAIAIGMVGLMAYYPGPGALPRGIGWGLPAAALFAGTVLSERWKIGSLGILHVLGAASYSLYLVHLVVFIYVASYFRRSGLALYSPPLLTAALWLVGCIVAALALYAAFEKPVTRFLQRRVRCGPGLPSSKQRAT